MNRIYNNTYPKSSKKCGIVKEYVEDDISVDSFEGKLSNLKNTIQNWIDKYGSDACIESYDYFEAYGKSEPYTKFQITIDRPETEEEMKERLNEHSRQIDKQEERDLEEFQRLKNKFDKK